MPNASIQDVHMEAGLELRAVVGLDELDLERQLLQDVVDALDGGLLVEPFVDLEDPEPGAVIDGGVLVVLLANPLDRLDEFDIDLNCVTGLRLLVSLPALSVAFVALRGRKAIEVGPTEDAPDARGTDGDRRGTASDT